MERTLNSCQDDVVKKKKPGSKGLIVDDSVKAVDETDGKGLEVIFDTAKCLYILSGRTEDCLLLLLARDPLNTYVIKKAYMRGPIFDPGQTKIGSGLNVHIIDNNKRRLWRRFVRYWYTTRFSFTEFL